MAQAGQRRLYAAYAGPSCGRLETARAFPVKASVPTAGQMRSAVFWRRRQQPRAGSFAPLVQYYRQSADEVALELARRFAADNLDAGF